MRNGAVFFVRGAVDIWILKETVLDREYERNGLAIQDGWTIVDIGAGLGDFAVSMARRFRDSAVFAYEPFPESFDLLRRNVDLNGVGNVRIFPVAVGASSGLLSLNTGFKEAVQHSTVVRGVGADRTVRVQSASLGDVFSEHCIETCDLLKIDCEGAEYEILMNADAASLRRIRHIAMEYHDGLTSLSHTDLEAHLIANGFAVEVRSSTVQPDIGLLFATRTGTINGAASLAEETDASGRGDN